jgi:hypothetical protein
LFVYNVANKLKKVANAVKKDPEDVQQEYNFLSNTTFSVLSASLLDNSYIVDNNDKLEQKIFGDAESGKTNNVRDTNEIEYKNDDNVYNGNNKDKNINCSDNIIDVDVDDDDDGLVYKPPVDVDFFRKNSDPAKASQGLQISFRNVCYSVPTNDSTSTSTKTLLPILKNITGKVCASFNGCWKIDVIGCVSESQNSWCSYWTNFVQW